MPSWQVIACVFASCTANQSGLAHWNGSTIRTLQLLSKKCNAAHLCLLKATRIKETKGEKSSKKTSSCDEWDISCLVLSTTVLEQDRYPSSETGVSESWFGSALPSLEEGGFIDTRQRTKTNKTFSKCMAASKSRSKSCKDAFIQGSSYKGANQHSWVESGSERMNGLKFLQDKVVLINHYHKHLAGAIAAKGVTPVTEGSQSHTKIMTF